MPLIYLLESTDDWNFLCGNKVGEQEMLCVADGKCIPYPEITFIEITAERALCHAYGTGNDCLFLADISGHDVILLHVNLILLHKEKVLMG